MVSGGNAPITGVPHRSWAWLTGAPCSVGLAPPFHLSPSFLAHEHRTASLLLPSASIHFAVAENASPVMNRATAPPCTAVTGFPSSIGRTTGTVGFARGWGVRRWSWPGLRPRCRRDLAGQRRPGHVSLTSGVPLTRGPACMSLYAPVGALHWVYLAF
jgi:hypothetical protein